MQINDFDFNGKTVIVTGASRGIGKAMAFLFAAQGATVVRTGTKSSEGVWGLDFQDDVSLKAFIGHLQELDRIDVLVNNAGINKIDLIYDVQDEDWDRIIKVNLTGAERLMKEVSRIMIDKSIKGRMLNVSSIFGIISKSKRNAYSAGKAGLIGLTRSTSLDLAPHGILVNALCPGFVDTDMTASILSAQDKKDLSEVVPLGRFAKEEEIARAAVYLCSGLNTYMTGQTFVIDGGYSAQ
jgi:3-oxoacyl-[acyl-carrier protein] reductase